MESWIKGADVSSLLEVEARGGRFYNEGTEQDALEILKAYGINMIRLRLWNNPYSEQGTPYGAGTCDLRNILMMARRLRQLDMAWMLDFQYSDFWADPGKQIMPKTWQGMNEAQLEQAVYNYTFSVMTILKEEGLLPAIAAIGNELTNGLLWPVGKVPAYGSIARLLGAGIRAVHQVDAGVKTMIHLDNGGNQALYRNWFDHYFDERGEDFDYIGLSYYPFWHGTMPELMANMNDLALRYHKDLIVAETSTGHTMEDYKTYEQLDDDQRKGMATRPELAAKVSYPMSAEGQCAFIQDLMTGICHVPEGRGKGFVYWEPAWIPVPGCGWANEAALAYTGEKGPGGNEWANQALFDYEGHALPALKTIQAFTPV